MVAFALTFYAQFGCYCYTLAKKIFSLFIFYLIFLSTPSHFKGETYQSATPAIQFFRNVLRMPP